MKLGIKVVAVAILALGLAVPAQALTITPASGTINVTRWEGVQGQTSQTDIDAAIAAFIGSSTELYKSNVGTGEEGPLAGSYETQYFNTPGDPMDATVTYISGTVVGPTAYALLKDGAASPSWYLFNLTALGWNGTEILQFTGFWPEQGAISHVALYGTSTSVPDGGSVVMLLGAALMGLAGFRRFVK